MPRYKQRALLVTIGCAAAWYLALCSYRPLRASGQPTERTDRTGLAQSPWPIMLGNVRNTGSANSPGSRQEQPWIYEDLGADRSILGAPAIDADGTLYIGADCLYAFDGATGRKEWGTRFGNIFNCSPIIGFDKTVYVSEHYSFCALDGRTGRELWRFKAVEGPRGSLFGIATAGALSADGLLYITSLEGNLYALNSATGKERWRFVTHQQIYGSPTIGADGTVYFTGYEGLYAVDGKSGKLRWNIPHCSVFGPPALAADGNVYVKMAAVLADGKHQNVSIIAVDGQTGNKKWDFPMGKGESMSPAVGEDGTVYATFAESWEGPAPGKVIAIDGKTGMQKWAYLTAEGILLAPAIGPDGTIYVGSRGGIMYALNGATGAQKWQVDIGAAIGTPVAVGANGLIYFGANDGVVYALRASDGAMAPRPK